MFSDAALHVMRAAKASPTATALACTALGFYTVRMHYMKKTLAHLEQNNRELQAQLKEKKDEVSQRLQLLEEAVKKDMTQRDAFLRKMELQNVEQTRSVDRLQHALRSCSLGNGSSGSSSSSSTSLNNNTNNNSNNSNSTVSVSTSQTPTTTATATDLPLTSATPIAPQLPPSPAVDTTQPAAAAVSITAVSGEATANNTSAPPSSAAASGADKASSQPVATIVEVPSGSAVPHLSTVPTEEFIVIQEIDRLDQLRNKIVQQQHQQASEITTVVREEPLTSAAPVASTAGAENGAGSSPSSSSS